MLLEIIKIKMKEENPLESKEMFRIGKVIEIIILLGGLIAMTWVYQGIGFFLTCVILFDWFFSLFYEKKKFHDYLYSWKCLLKIKNRRYKNVRRR